jgi:hypothetical protein
MSRQKEPAGSLINWPRIRNKKSQPLGHTKFRCKFFALSSMKTVSSSDVADPGCLFRIRIFLSRIRDPESKRFRIRIKEFRLNKDDETVSKLSEKLSGMFIPFLYSDFSPSRIQEKKTPDPGSGSTTLVTNKQQIILPNHILISNMNRILSVRYLLKEILKIQFHCNNLAVPTG